jgi:riboflavin kinase/FMN adenylyltransferase
MAEAPAAVIGGVRGLSADHGALFAVIGVFDGLHLGHQYLLRHLVDEARARGARPAVITFDSHPDEVLVGAAPPLLLDPRERIRLLEDAGVAIVVVEHFDAALRMTEYDDFLHRITSRTTLAGLLMTPDAAFGHDRRGTPEAVATLGERDGFDLVVVPPFALDGRSVRSSDIRAAIAAGDLGLAARLLGRAYSLVGAVGADGCLTFPMPVAVPPAGTYSVVLEGDESPVSLLVDGGGTMRLEPSPDPSPGARRLVTFIAG